MRTLTLAVIPLLCSAPALADDKPEPALDGYCRERSKDAREPERVAHDCVAVMKLVVAAVDARAFPEAFRLMRGFDKAHPEPEDDRPRKPRPTKRTKSHDLTDPWR